MVFVVVCSQMAIVCRRGVRGRMKRMNEVRSVEGHLSGRGTSWGEVFNY